MAANITSIRERAQKAADKLPSPRGGQLMMFPTPKRPRGRPRKAVASPSTDSFDIVCAAIRGIPKGQALARAKAEARRIVDRDRNIGKSAAALFDRILDALNHKLGKDWHSVGFYAGRDQCDRPRRTVERAYEELVKYGHLLRRRLKKKGGWDVSETTVPTLAKAAFAAAEEDAQPEAEDDGEKTRSRYRWRVRGVPTKKSQGTDEKIPGYRLKNTEGTDQKTGLSSKGNFKENIQREDGEVSAREAAGDKFENSDFQESADASGVAPHAPAAVPARLDQSLPLRQRITAWSFGRPSAAADAAVYDRMRRLAKGWDPLALREQFCGWLEAAKAAPPRDAQAAFLAWLQRTAERRPTVGRASAAPHAQEFSITDPKALLAVWRAEDERDGPLRAALWPGGGASQGYRPLGRLIARIINNLPGANA